MKDSKENTTIEQRAQAAIDPDLHDAYWQEHHAEQPYAQPGRTYEQYRSAYRIGVEGARKHGFELKHEELEPKLEQDYASVSDSNRVAWEHGRPAALAAYHRGAQEGRIILHEERLKVGKREVASGQVHVHKVVHTEQVNVPVELRREGASVERIAASDLREGTSSKPFEEQTIEVALHQEEAVVAKEAHITGGVRVSKTAQVEKRVISDTIQKEDVEVIREGEPELQAQEKSKESNP